MKEIQKRMLLQIVLGFLLGRVILFGRNPVGAAYFAAGFVQGGSVVPVGIAVCLGMITVLPIETVLRYALGMFAIGLAADLLRHRQITLKMGHSALIMAVVSSLFSVVQFFIVPFLARDVLFLVSDIVLILVFSRIFYEGLGYLLHSQKLRMNNEEIISLIIMGAMAVYGLPDILIGDIFLPEFAIYLFLPMIGYQYGAGMGAVAGAAGGTLLALFGRDSDMIGMLSLLGICAGMLRRQGKAFMLSAFVVLAVGLGYLINGDFLPMGTFKVIVIDSLFLLLVPDKYLRRFHFVWTPKEERWTKENFQGLMKHKLEDYSKSFQALSQAMSKDTRTKEGINKRDMRRLMQEMSEEICEHCEHCHSCMGQVALRRSETIGSLALAQEQGNLLLDQMPADFTRECIHPQHFMMEANQSIRMARTIMGFQNRMVQSRQIIAGQMAQVGDLLEGLAEDMLHTSTIPGNVEEKIIQALSSRNVAVKNLVIYENKENRMEIHMQAETVKGRLKTSKEAAQIISGLMDKPFVPSEDSRNVIPRQGTKLVFLEEAPFYAVTGVARLPKDGEEISGDTFSCLSLPNGELLLALSDGMGSGEDALEESQTVIELLEQMAEAGFSRLSAIRLINSLYLPEEESNRYATADVSILNLYEGTCQFLKSGAAATWIRHGKEVRCIEGQSLPIGIIQDAEPYLEKSEISSGDYVIMVTDGVSDAFAGRPEAWEDFLVRCKAVNPQDMADQILDEAIRQSEGKIKDDMSVIVAGVWEGI